MRTLDQIAVGQTAEVISIRPEAPSSNLMSALGLLPGKQVRVERLAPLGDPICVVFEGQRISLRRRDAADVIVQ